MSSPNKKMAHLFHWPSFREYQESLPKVIALPTGARGKLPYRDKWVNNTFIDQIGNINECGEFDAMFWVLSCKYVTKNNKVVATFDFACPIRLVTILKVETRDPYYDINFVAQQFISKVEKFDESALRHYTKIKFDSLKIPYPGVEKSYAHVGPKIDVETAQTISLEPLSKVLENIPCSLEYTEGITINNYPLLKIETIDKSEINQSGLYELSINQEYEIAFSYHQGDLYRNRNIYVNGNRVSGRSGTGKISTGEITKTNDKIDIEIKWDNLIYIIPLSAFIKIPWYKRRLTPLFLMAGTSAIVIGLFLRLFPKSDIQIKTALIFALIVMLLDKIWQVSTKKG